MSIDDKKRMSRTDLIEKRFELMVNMAEKLRNKTNYSQLADKEQYIRICGEGYMSVSLADKSPLLGIGAQEEEIEKVLKHLEEKQAKELSDKVWKSKKERRLQAWLIKRALTHNRSLRESLRLEDHFGELLFCLDEVSLGDSNHERDDSKDRPKIVRSDILALGLQGGVYYPVLIELKYKRELKRLIEQLDNFIKDVEDHSSVNDVFIDLLRTCSGVEKSANLSNNFKKIIIWPKSKNPRKSTVEKLNENGVLEIEYEYGDGDYGKIDKWIFTPRV